VNVKQYNKEGMMVLSIGNQSSADQSARLRFVCEAKKKKKKNP
jgi:hypothetical protein